MSDDRKRRAAKPVPADWERRWIAWAKREIRRSEKELLRGQKTADTSSGAPRHLPLKGKPN